MPESSYSRDAYGKTLVELGESDPNVVVLDADLSGSTRTAFFAKKFPQRFFNMGVAEQNLIATAAGIASCGKIVFVSTFSMFASIRALDQLRNTVVYNGFNVKIVATHGGITVGEDGASHQALEDISFVRSLPGMKVIVPCDGEETRNAVLSAYKENGPFYIRIGRSKTPVLENKPKFALGKGYILNEGEDVVVIACGIMCGQALQALSLLKAEGINPYVVNIHTIKPIDKELIVNLASKVKGFVVCEEHSIIGGLGSAVCETLSESLPKPVKRIGTKDRFGQSGSSKDLLLEYGLTPENIAKQVKDLLL